MLYRNQSAEEIKGKHPIPWRLFLLSWFFVLICFSFYFFSEKIFLPILEKQNQNLKVKITGLSDEINNEDRQKMVHLWSQTENLRKILKDHIYPTKLLSKIESFTPKEIVFKQITIDLKKKEIEITGYGDINAIAYYAFVLEKSKEFFNVRLGRVEKGMFQIKSNFDLDLVRF